MKLLNYTTSYFAALLLVMISIWAGIFYYAMLDEIYDSIDDGLDNRKGLILQKLAVDSSVLKKTSFEEGDYSINKLNANTAVEFKDVYIDTLMYMQNEQEYEPVRLLKTAFLHDGEYYRMQVITSMVEEDDLVSELFYALLWLYLGLITTILLLNNVLLKRIWKPFYRLLKQLKAFRLEKPSMDLPATNIAEFQMLNEAVQKLLQNSIDSYNSQKHFIENAAHELQTPLAISINKLEALADSSNLSGQQMQLLGSALDNLERLTRLNRSLLLLSKIENRQFLVEERVHINQITKKILDDFSDQVSYSNIQVIIEETDDVFVTMNPDLAVVLITNLVKNAIVHNHQNGQIKITLSKNAFTIGNTGKDQALTEQALFNRFYKEAQAQTSTGLGLAIVKAIVNLYHFNIRYSFQELHRMHVSFQQ